jgi:hypothetical protein
MPHAAEWPEPPVPSDPKSIRHGPTALPSPIDTLPEPVRGEIGSK